jgi:hypothetical protein
LLGAEAADMAPSTSCGWSVAAEHGREAGAAEQGTDATGDGGGQDCWRRHGAFLCLCVECEGRRPEIGD